MKELIQINSKEETIQMGRQIEQTFYQRRHIQSQQVHRRRFNIANPQGYANQNHSKISLHTCLNGYYLKEKEKKNYEWGCREKGTLVHCWWKCKLVQPLWKTVWQFLKNTKNRTTVCGSKSSSGYLLKENKNIILKRYMLSNIHCSIIHYTQHMK